MYCSSCGAQIADGSAFCPKCGASLNTTDKPAVQQNYYPPQTVVMGFSEMNLPEKYRPLGAWAYFGYTLLFAIPIIGFIMLIVFSFSDTNINRRNFARSYWCVLVLALIVVGILLLLGLSIFGITANQASTSSSIRYR